MIEQSLQDHVNVCAELQRDVIRRLSKLERLVWMAMGATGVLGTIFYIVGDKILHLLS